MRPHILLVEDEQHLGVGIKYNLEAESYRVTLVEDGATALKLIDGASDSIDLIILDLMLPGMSGYKVCETIRQAGLMTPVLMLSARILPEDRSRGFDVGANQYMNKPFELDELISRIKNLLLTSGTRPAVKPIAQKAEPVEAIEFGQLKVDFRTHEASVEGSSVKMTPKELNLLKYLVENPDRVISRSELLSNVWEVDGNVQTRAVDQFIARLRKIIEPDSSNPVHLKTIRDAGYRLIIDPSGNVDASDAVKVDK